MFAQFFRDLRFLFCKTTNEILCFYMGAQLKETWIVLSGSKSLLAVLIVEMQNET